ncbi:MAG TPA: DUF1573 domain-containing protein [Vicinamibacteria bacterium]|nr:DUF1573 domain-containing protein [Vicinamibacteria bacterium]
MRVRLTLHLVAAALAGASAALAQAPLSTPASVPSPTPSPVLGLVVEEPAARFGEAYTGTEVAHTFAVRNDGTQPVRIVSVSPNTPPTRVDPLPAPIPSGGRAMITIRQGTQGRMGNVSYRFLLKTDDGLPDRHLSLAGFLQSAYEPDQPVLDGVAGPGQTIEVSLASREVERLDVLGVDEAPAFLRVDTSSRGPDGAVRLRVTPTADAPLGVHRGALVVRTNVTQQPWINVPFRLSVFGDVSPEDVPVDLGTIREGQPFEKATRLLSRTGQAVEVASIEGAPQGVTVESRDCPEPAASCRALVFKGVGPAAPTTLGGEVRVRLAGGRDMSLPFRGVVVRADAIVQRVDEAGGKPSGVIPYPKPTPPPVPPPVTGRPGERLARLTWNAGHEEQTFGYLIYRADKPEGPYRRVNASIVPVIEGPPPHRYTYEDREVEAGRSYFYYLESISKTGQKSRLSGVVTKVIPPAP